MCGVKRFSLRDSLESSRSDELLLEAGGALLAGSFRSSSLGVELIGRLLFILQSKKAYKLGERGKD